MDFDVIDHYIDRILRVQLNMFGTGSDFLERVLNTVRGQIQSCVYHWDDIGFRKALLLIGSEEGIGYMPKANDDVRNFVVVAIRNSEFESLQSKAHKQAGLKSEIGDVDVRKITSSAIEYFCDADFLSLQKAMKRPSPDKYYDLSRKYPVSWNALTYLANAKTQSVNFDGINIKAGSTIEMIPTDNDAKTVICDMTGNVSKVTLISDGISFAIDSHLRGLLADCIDYKIPFLVPSFKFLTRNIEKLLLIIEHLISNDVPFVTANYYISNGHAARRMKLIRAGRSYDDGIRAFKDTAGLTAKHRAVLISATAP